MAEEEEIEEMQHGPFFIELRQCVRTVCYSMWDSLRSNTLEYANVRFEKALKSREGFAPTPKDCFDLLMAAYNESFEGIEQIGVKTLATRMMIWRDSNVYVEAKLSMLMSLFEEKLNRALSEPVKSLLNDASDKTWPKIRRLVQQERMTTLVVFASTISLFDIDQTIVNKLVVKLEKYAISVVESLAREEAARVLINMKDRFNKVFSYDSHSMKRLWTGKEDIKAITKLAHSASLKLLCVIAAIRLDGEKDNIKEILQLALVDEPGSASNTICSLDPLASNTWENVPRTRTLIAPIKCKILWRQFRKQTKYTVDRAIAAQEIYKRKNNQFPPPWAITAILILGFNEFSTILSNPSYLWVIFATFLLGAALYVQLYISGALFWILSLPMKFHSTVMNLLKKQRPIAAAPARNLP